ncbi:MAG: alpha-amylase family glycosyl hydrolase [Ferruginibacter sp.]
MKPLAIIIFLGFLFGCNHLSKHMNMEPQQTDAVSFSPVAWAHNTNVYEVNLRQYTQEGSFNAFAKELPRLKQMGVQTLWFMPVTPIAQLNKKGSLGSPYAARDYTAINPEFGTLADFKSLVKQAHELGFKVIIDWVANHTGWDHKWTKEHPEYYKKDSTGNFNKASGMDDIIELDYGNPELRKAMIDAMEYWVKECDIDGYRCDLAFWVRLDFWQEARAALEKTKKLFWLGEFDALEHPDYMQVFDVSYSWTWMHKTEEYYKGKIGLDSLRHILERYDTAGGHNKMKLWFTANHDENSWNGTEYEKYGDMAKALAVFSFTWDGVPLIYSGQELPNMKRLQFFQKDVIAWNGKYQLADFYNSLLELRENNAALKGGDSNVKTFLLHTDHPGKILAYLRKNGDKEVLVLLNLSKDAVHFTTQENMLKNNYKKVFGDEVVSNLTGKTSFDLQPWAYDVYEK